MPFEMTLWNVLGPKLEEIQPSRLDEEQRLEDWIFTDPSVLGMDLAVVGRQVQTEFGGRIDILALDDEGNCVVLELKRGRTPRDVVAQLLDYGSWVKSLRYVDLEQIAQQYKGKTLAALFNDAFGATIPETVNESHTLILVASELDDSSERIIDYLSNEYELPINAVFFRCFRQGDRELVGRAWLKDPAEAIERAETSRRAPWSGYWFVNVGEGPHRTWTDNVKYGYIGAGQGEKYSRPLRRLSVGDKIFAYMKGLGYVGFGEVVRPAQPIGQFVVEGLGKTLLDLPLTSMHAGEHKDSPEMCEWVVGIRWLAKFPSQEAKTFRGVFANQNIVCKLRDPKTVQFLESEFGLQPRGGDLVGSKTV